MDYLWWLFGTALAWALFNALWVWMGWAEREIISDDEGWVLLGLILYYIAIPVCAGSLLWLNALSGQAVAIIAAFGICIITSVVYLWTTKRVPY